MEQPHTQAVGIDLGTTFSVIACIDAQNRPMSIANAEGDITTPSVVLFDHSSIVVGKEAVKAAAMEPDRVADFPKRDMGSEHYSRAVGGEYFPPEVIQSLILEKLKRDAEAKLGPVNKAVITVPAFFNEPRRKATQDAGQLAGFDVLDLINEPTAAAIAYGRQQGFLSKTGEAKQAETILVYDLGGGTFDVTLMHIDGKQYSTLATAGDVYLGGLDWDRRLADHIAEEFQAKFRGIDPRQNPAGLTRLLREAEDAKRALSAREQTTVTFEYAGEGIRLSVTREDLERLTEDLLQRTIFTTRSVLKDAGLKWTDVTRLLLVGGSARMPAVERALEQDSGLTVDRSLSADESVAHGAAIYADLLMSARAGEQLDVSVKNVNSHNLGVLGTDGRTGRMCNKVIIPRNTPLPVTKGKRFKTGKANQRSISVKIVEGGDSSGRNSTVIGRCVIRNLPEGLTAESPVDVYFKYEENGRLLVRAQLPGLDYKAVLTIDRETGLNDDKLGEWNRRLHRPEGPLKM